MATITHAKTNNITDWTQADLDAQIALGNFPPGTLLADIVLPTDWNNNHNLTLGADENFVTDAQLVVIGNTSGTNTGDQTSIVGITGTKAQFDTACTDGNFLYTSDITPAALTRTNDTNVTLTLGGTPATALLQATSITVGWSGQLGVSRGGTGGATESDAIFNLGSGLADGVGAAEDPIDTRIRYITYNDSSGISYTFTGADLFSAISGGLSGTYQPLDSDLTALAGNSTNGFWARTGAGTGAARTMTGTANEITVTNGAGGGTPTWSLPTALTFTGKTITGGTYDSVGNITMATGNNFRTGTTSGNTYTFQAYDVDGAAYVPFLAATAGNNPSLTGILGSPAGYAAFDAGGNLTFTGGQYLLSLDQFAFAVNGLATTGIKFRFFTGVPGYVCTDLAGGDIASVDVAGTDSVLNAVYGFANGMTSPASIGANQNNYAGFIAGIVRLTSSGAFNITGAVAPTNSRAQQKYIYNVGANNITLTHEDAASTAANRFRNTTLANIVLAPDEGAICNYDTVTARWRCSKL